ncbi:MAG: AsmA family protein [Bdellovibrionota bacterium]
MKKVLKIVVFLVLVSAVAVALLLWNINPVLSTFKPQIEQRMSDAAHRPVTIGELSLKLYPFAVSVSDVVLQASKPESGASTRIKTLVLATKLMPLLHKELQVTEVGIEGADIALSRTSDGQIELSGAPLGATKTTSPDTEPAPEKSGGPIQLEVKSAWVKGSRISFTDHKVSPPQVLVLDDLTADLKDITTSGVSKLQVTSSFFGTEKNNLTLSGAASVAGGAPNADLELDARALDFNRLSALAAAYGGSNKDVQLAQQGNLKASIKLSTGGIQISGKFDGSKASLAYGQLFQKAADIPFTVETSGQAFLQGGVDLSQLHIRIADMDIDVPVSLRPKGPTKAVLKTSALPLGSIGKVVPLAQPYQLTGALDANCTVSVPSPGSPPQLEGTAQVKGLGAHVPGDTPLTLSNINTTVKSTPKGFTLEPTSLPIFGGNITVQGSLVDGSALDAQVQGQKLDLAQLAAFAKSKVGLTGSLDSMNLSVKGPMKELSERANGALQATASNGVIEGFNLLGATFGKLGSLPVIGPVIQSIIPEKYRPLLQANSTAFSHLDLKATFAGKSVSLTSITLQHELYLVDGQGSIAQNGDMEITAKLRFTPQLVQDLVAKEKKLSLLLDKDQNIVVPLILRRTNGKFLVLPDVTDLAKRAVNNSATDAVTQKLDKVAPGLGGALKSLFK